ncbi:MAG: POTRA domain-containing protein [Pyrinomonadaceae bacterium]
MIVEGERRLRNRAQQQGYFFAEVKAICSVNPPFAADIENNPGTGAELCANVNPDELTDRKLAITYQVELGRRFKLTDIRLEGTNKLSIADIEDELRTQRATLLGFIPLLGYGRGYTSVELLTQDANTIEARMRDLGYRKAEATVRQGVSIDGESLIITFDVNEGPLTRLTDTEVRGNQLFTADRLREARCRNVPLEDPGCLILGGPFSASIARADGERIRGLYVDEGYVGTTVALDLVELPPAANGDEGVRVIYAVNEGNKVYINRIITNGNVRTSREAILKSIPLKEGQVLRAGSLRESERLLFATGAFRQVVIRPERLQGETREGYRHSDIVIELEEQKQRDLTYGFGYSTDNGPLGLVELRNNNLFGELQQGSVRIRASQRRQLARIEFFNPRFSGYGEPTRFCRYGSRRSTSAIRT